MFIYTADYFSTFIHFNIFQTKNWETFCQFRVFVFNPIPENENAEFAESPINFSYSSSDIY